MTKAELAKDRLAAMARYDRAEAERDALFARHARCVEALRNAEHVLAIPRGDPRDKQIDASVALGYIRYALAEEGRQSEQMSRE